MRSAHNDIDDANDAMFLIIAIAGDQLGQVHVDSPRVRTFPRGSRPHLLSLHKVTFFLDYFCWYGRVGFNFGIPCFSLFLHWRFSSDDRRIGKNGSDDIKSHPFFANIDFSSALRTKQAPYKPTIKWVYFLFFVGEIIFQQSLSTYDFSLPSWPNIVRAHQVRDGHEQLRPNWPG